MEKLLNISNVKKNYYYISDSGNIRTADGRPVFRDPADNDKVLLLSEREQSYHRTELKKLVIKMFVPKPPFCWIFIDENAPGQCDANKMRYQMGYDFSKMSNEEAQATRNRCIALFEWSKYHRKSGTKNITPASVLTYYYQFNPTTTPKSQVIMDTDVTEQDYDWFWRQYNLGYDTSTFKPTVVQLPSSSIYKGTTFKG